MDPSPPLPIPETPQFLARHWREAFARLSATTPPCPGIRSQQWPEMHTAALQFLSEHADRAAALGWTTEELFGVHPEVGAVRVDACGALVLAAGGAARSVEADQIRFGNTSYYKARERPHSTSVWDYREKPPSRIQRKA